MTQGEKYDSDAEYIKRHVSELADIDPENVYAWHELGAERREEVAPDYPDLICEHGERREQAIEMFE